MTVPARAPQARNALRLLKTGLAAALALAFAPGCAPHMTLPDDFARVHWWIHTAKYLTPEDARLWLREFAAGTEAGLDFWTRTLENDLVENRGYTLLGKEEVQDGEGNRGVLLSFEATVEGQPYRYDIAIFPVSGLFGPKIRTVELLTPQAHHERYGEALRKGLPTLDW